VYRACLRLNYAYDAQAPRLLQRLAVLGSRWTVGKLAEALNLDYATHRRAWTAIWLT
jgi:hypothetical protein